MEGSAGPRRRAWVEGRAEGSPIRAAAGALAPGERPRGARRLGRLGGKVGVRGPPDPAHPAAAVVSGLCSGAAASPSGRPVQGAPRSPGSWCSSGTRCTTSTRCSPTWSTPSSSHRVRSPPLPSSLSSLPYPVPTQHGPGPPLTASPSRRRRPAALRVPLQRERVPGGALPGPVSLQGSAGVCGGSGGMSLIRRPSPLTPFQLHQQECPRQSPWSRCLRSRGGARWPPGLWAVGGGPPRAR